MKLAHLRARAAYWQDRLNLKEWKIFVQWGDAREMEEENAVGLSNWCAEELTATVKIRRGEPSHEMEPTLVHELLHVLLQGHENYDGKYDVHLERSINRLAAALCTQNANE